MSPNYRISPKCTKPLSLKFSKNYLFWFSL